MDLNELTIGEVKQLQSLLAGNIPSRGERKHDFEVGKRYFIRSVTHHLLGHVVEVCDLCVVMDKCTWIADDGKFSAAMRGEWSDSAEHEIYPPEVRVSVYFGGLIDSCQWTKSLITSTK